MECIFLLFPQCIQKVSFLGLSKLDTMMRKVKPLTGDNILGQSESKAFAGDKINMS